MSLNYLFQFFIGRLRYPIEVFEENILCYAWYYFIFTSVFLGDSFS